MKFSIVYIFILAQEVIAMPWFRTKTETAGDEITLGIKVSQGSFHPSVLPKKKAKAAVGPRECWPACFQERSTVLMDGCDVTSVY
ncbi:hypothetical protein J7337_007971 [Fusarium musae]|uniref:Secreted protein n=1 Tax=Fusarium musae TaxID=1042133 RepID=A0A9P8DCR8_9HYPO|nr:hypothetical protein J7337_007971 [Fusarium musae]KAG9499515.1 hypothetical protein J7337_007971 [Fusarium musae]